MNRFNHQLEIKSLKVILRKFAKLQKKSGHNDDKLTLNVSKQYTKNKADFDFFSDAKE